MQASVGKDPSAHEPDAHDPDARVRAHVLSMLRRLSALKQQKNSGEKLPQVEREERRS